MKALLLLLVVAPALARAVRPAGEAQSSLLEASLSASGAGSGSADILETLNAVEEQIRATQRAANDAYEEVSQQCEQSASQITAAIQQKQAEISKLNETVQVHNTNLDMLKQVVSGLDGKISTKMDEIKRLRQRAEEIRTSRRKASAINFLKMNETQVVVSVLSELIERIDDEGATTGDSGVKYSFRQRFQEATRGVTDPSLLRFMRVMNGMMAPNASDVKQVPDVFHPKDASQSPETPVVENPVSGEQLQGQSDRPSPQTIPPSSANAGQKDKKGPSAEDLAALKKLVKLLETELRDYYNTVAQTERTEAAAYDAQMQKISSDFDLMQHDVDEWNRFRNTKQSLSDATDRAINQAEEDTTRLKVEIEPLRAKYEQLRVPCEEKYRQHVAETAARREQLRTIQAIMKVADGSSSKPAEGAGQPKI